MKKEDLFDAVTDINDGFIEEAAAAKRQRIARIVRFAGNAAAILVIAVVLLRNGGFEKKKSFDAVASTEAVAEETSMKEDFILDNKVADFETETNSFGTAGSFIDDPNLVMASSLPLMAQAPDMTDEMWEDDSAYEKYEELSRAHSADIERQRDIIPAADDDTDGFTGKLVTKLFADSKTDNLTVSPINVYLALSILAETTGEDTRNELLKVLGVKNIEGLRNNCNALWNYNYMNDGVTTSILGSSLWLNNSVSFNRDTLATIAENHRASTFSGEMGSPSLNASLQNWMNSMTGGLLEDQISNLELTPDMVASIITTIYFKDGWLEKFNSDANTMETFKGAKGDKTVTFMHRGDNGTLYRGKNYTASALSMNNGYSMLFLLPDEGKTPADLVRDKDALKFILSADNAPEGSHGMVIYNIPKFDVSSQIELSDTLKALGVNKVFDPEKANFKPLTDSPLDIFVSDVLHGARVKIDEEGCEAAAYTAIMMKATGFISDTYEFTLDRPFLFVIRNDMGAPLFVGVVNEIE